jgi:hypothetical protein
LLTLLLATVGAFCRRIDFSCKKAVCNPKARQAATRAMDGTF